MQELFTLGKLYPSDFLATGEEPRSEKIELKLLMDDLGRVRLEKTAPLDKMFGRYFYRSGINSTMKQELNDIVNSITKVIKLKENDLWIDIACFPEGNFINTDKGYIDIKNINIGDRVLSHDGKYHEVKKLFQRKFDGEFIKLKLRGLNTNTVMTHNHPILTQRGWIEAGDLKKDDLVSLRCGIVENKNNILDLFELSKICHKYEVIDLGNGFFESKSNGLKNILPKSIEINEELIEILGYYIGEGSGGGGSGLEFTFSDQELYKAKKVSKYFKEIFNINVEICQGQGTYIARLSSRILSSIFKSLFGHTAKNKKIPFQIINKELFPHFLNALWFTDGHFIYHRTRHNNYRKNYVFNSVSKNLILDLWNILESLGIICSVQHVKNNKGFSRHDGKIYRLTVERNESIKILETLFSGCICECTTRERFVKILEIQNFQDQIDVYNFEVDESNSYICNGISVHNCNDGTLLSFLPKELIKIGIDPVEDSYKEESEKHADIIIQDYFTAEAFKSTKYGNLKAKVVTSIAMFYDLENPSVFINDIYQILDNNGLWVLQLSYTPLMIEQMAFDNIVHEHFYYYSLFNLKILFEKHGFKIVDCQLNDTNGGSFRVYVMKDVGNTKNFATQPYRDICNFRINSLLKYEETLKLDSVDTWLSFFKRINELKTQTMDFIKAKKAEGKIIWGYGACHDMQTKLVTENGIKSFNEISINDKIYSLNMETNEIELSNIEEIMIFPYEGELINLYGKRINQMITPNHNVLFQTEQINKLRLELAKDIINRKYFKLPVGKWTGSVDNEKFDINKFVNQKEYNNKCRKIPEIFDTVDFMYLLGIFIGDGFSFNQSQGYSINLCIPKNDKARNKLIQTLNRMGLKYREYDHEIQIASKALYTIGLECNKGALNKKIPEWALQYTPKYLSKLLDGLIDSDGWYEKNGRNKFCSSSYRLIKDVVELCLKLGYYPSITKRKIPSKLPKINGRKIHSSGGWIVNIARTQPRSYNNKKIQYKGNVWCISTKNKNFLVERNGKICFSGNSTKGNTLLQYFGLDHTLINGIAERSPAKWGLKTVGTNIPIYSEDEMRKAKPDYLLILPWHFINEFRNREIEFIKNGGKMIVPCPKFEIID